MRPASGRAPGLSCPSFVPPGRTKQSLLEGGFQIGALTPSQGANSCISKGVAPTSFTKGKTCVHRWAPSCLLKGGGGASLIGEWTAGLARWLGGIFSWAPSEAATELCGPRPLVPCMYSAPIRPLPGVVRTPYLTCRLSASKCRCSGHVSWVCPVSSAELPVANIPRHSKLRVCGQATSWNLSLGNNEEKLPGERDLDF